MASLVQAVTTNELKQFLVLEQGGEPLSAQRIVEFEEHTSVAMPTEYRWFLIHVANGGFPRVLKTFPVNNIDTSGLSWCSLHGLYGLHTEVSIFDLWDSWAIRHMILGDVAYPIGYDDGDSTLCIRLDGGFVGQIWYCPWGEGKDADPAGPHLYFVAKSLSEFWSVLK